MRSVFRIGVALLCVHGEYFASVQPSVSNVTRYGSGRRSIGSSFSDFKYFENLTDIRLALPHSVTTGVRVLYDVPPEVGSEFKGLKRRFIEYDGETIFGRIGNFSKLFGRGLAFNLSENRGLGYDTWMDGINAGYKGRMFTISALAGILNFQDSVVVARDEIHRLQGGNIEIRPLSDLTLGLTYIKSRSTVTHLDKDTEADIALPSVYASYLLSDFALAVDYSHKSTRINSTGGRSDGAAYYGALTYNTDGLGITVDYKNYFFDERDPFERNDITRDTRMMPFQNPPTVMKEHSSTLLTRALHEVDFNDETGLQVEVVRSIEKDMELTFNGSVASRRSYYLFDEGAFRFSRQSRSAKYLPSLNAEYSPYWEVFGEVAYYFNEATHMKAAAALRSKVFYDEFFGGKNNHIISSTVLPIRINHRFTRSFSLEGHVEYEMVADNFNVRQPEYFNALFGLTGSLSSRVNVTVRYEHTNNRYDVSGRRDWFTLEAGFKIIDANTAVLSYGREKGGQICSNGVCRYIQPFEGFRASLFINI